MAQRERARVSPALLPRPHSSALGWPARSPGKTERSAVFGVGADMSASPSGMPCSRFWEVPEMPPGESGRAGGGSGRGLLDPVPPPPRAWICDPVHEKPWREQWGLLRADSAEGQREGRVRRQGWGSWGGRLPTPSTPDCPTALAMTPSLTGCRPSSGPVGRPEAGELWLQHRDQGSAWPGCLDPRLANLFSGCPL